MSLSALGSRLRIKGLISHWRSQPFLSKYPRKRPYTGCETSVYAQRNFRIYAVEYPYIWRDISSAFA